MTTTDTLSRWLDRLAEMERAATPGLWRPSVWKQHVERYVIEEPAEGPFSDLTKPGTTAEAVFSYTPPAEKQEVADTGFMCAIRNAAPAMIEALRAASTITEWFGHAPGCAFTSARGDGVAVSSDYCDCGNYAMRAALAKLAEIAAKEMP